MGNQYSKPALNRLLERSATEGSSTGINEWNFYASCNLIWNKEPFAHIENFAASRRMLNNCSVWLSYGGRRTGSTFTTMALKILLGSITENFLVGWEGDYKEPRKFFDLAKSNHTIEACILKIHRSEAYCNKLLSENNAKAIVSTRDYYSIAASFARMKNNKHSPFYSPKTLDDNQLIQFINYEISEHRKKQSLPNTLFIREDNIRNRPHEAIQSIANHMGIELSATSATSIGENLSIESQKARQESIIINSTGHDHECFMHHTHIKEEEKEYDTKYQDLVDTHFGDQLDKAGYLQ